MARKRFKKATHLKETSQVKRLMCIELSVTSMRHTEVLLTPRYNNICKRNGL